MSPQHPPVRILVAGDDPVSLSVLGKYLEQEGYSYVSAKTGQEALSLFNTHHFSIVISDWLNPEMDGTTLCRGIRRHTRDYYTFIILLTSQNSPKSLIEGLESGADDYIVKPVNPAELRARLKGYRRILDLEDSLRQSLSEIRELSIHDPLTGAFNRGYFDRQLGHEIGRAYRYQHPLSLILCDLDHFKLINDVYGHQTGDEVLKRCVQNINKSIRHNIDWVARYGGEEFVITLPETDAAGCSVVAERIRERIAFNPDRAEGSMLKISASFGAVTLVPESLTGPVSAADLVQRADICLYLAKQTGRNRVVAEFMQ